VIYGAVVGEFVVLFMIRGGNRVHTEREIRDPHESRRSKCRGTEEIRAEEQMSKVKGSLSLPHQAYMFLLSMIRLELIWRWTRW
jgi:hypothetical protein